MLRLCAVVACKGPDGPIVTYCSDTSGDILLDSQLSASLVFATQVAILELENYMRQFTKSVNMKLAKCYVMRGS